MREMFRRAGTAISPSAPLEEQRETTGKAGHCSHAQLQSNGAGARP